MFRRYFLPLLAGVTIIISANLIASAQVGQLRGHVVLKQADGTTIPAADAGIDVFRTDLSGKYTTKTNKKGEFVFAGLPYVGTYIVAASHPAAQPNWAPNVKAGRDTDYMIELSPGDGRRLTLDEIRAANRGAKSGAAEPTESRAPTAEEKAKIAEEAKKIAEIAAKNEKATKSNEIVARTFQAGNEAFTAKNYDVAIAQYEEGLAADPEQPALLVNEARAYTSRGVNRYNAAVTSKDDAAKTAGIDGAKADFRAAAAATTKAVGMIKAQPVPTEPAELAKYNNNKLAAFTVNAEAHRLFVSKADPSQADAGLAAYKDYIAVETDPVKKAKAQLDAAQLLLDAGAVDKAFTEFQAIITAEPDNPDANLGAGLSLFASGDKAKYQDAANYLQHYVDVAPETHKFKADAKAILAELKNTEKVVPEKTTPTRRRRP
jgi:tetratricopeptide (TPR) repeat protein